MSATSPPPMGVPSRRPPSAWQPSSTRSSPASRASRAAPGRPGVRRARQRRTRARRRRIRRRPPPPGRGFPWRRRPRSGDVRPRTARICDDATKVTRRRQHLVARRRVPRPRAAACSAAVPFETATAWRAPHRRGERRLERLHHRTLREPVGLRSRRRPPRCPRRRSAAGRTGGTLVTPPARASGRPPRRSSSPVSHRCSCRWRSGSRRRRGVPSRRPDGFAPVERRLDDVAVVELHGVPRLVLGHHHLVQLLAGPDAR